MNPYLLLILGMLLIFIEFFLPGAVMGTLGALLILLSIGLFANQTESSLALLGYIFAIGVGLYYTAKFALWRMQKTSSKQTICSDASQEGYVASTYDASTIGKQGVVIADLKPGGYVAIDGQKQQAISVSGYLSQGCHVEVIGGQEESLIVKQIQKEEI